MGAIFGIVALIILLCIGLTLMAGGIVPLIINHKRGHFRLRWLCNTGAVILLICGLAVTAFPAGFFGMLVMGNTAPPDGFVRTDITIKESGYQDTRFTADGTTYIVLPFEADYESCENAATAVFTYYGSGLFNRRESGNYYRLPSDFDLIWDGSSLLFCPQEQYDTVVQHYPNSNIQWYDATDEASRPLLISGEVEQFLSDQGSAYNPQAIALTYYPERYFIKGCSQDGFVTFYYHELLLIDGHYYICHGSMICMGDGYYHCDVTALPQAASDALHDILTH